MSPIVLNSHSAYYTGFSNTCDFLTLCDQDDTSFWEPRNIWITLGLQEVMGMIPHFFTAKRSEMRENSWDDTLLWNMRIGSDTRHGVGGWQISLQFV